MRSSAAYNVAACCLVLASKVQGFIGVKAFPKMNGYRVSARRTTNSADPSNDPSCARDVALSMALSDEGSSSRRHFAQSLAGGVALGLGALLAPAVSEPAAAATSSLEEIEADLILCKEVFKPTLQYLKAEQFDAARTNTNYITRFFNLKKKIDSLIVQANDVVDDTDKLEKAFELAQEVEALFTNFDATVYTIIFIPADADGVLPPGAEKYLKQAYGYYDDINKVLDFYIGLVPAETKEAAEKLVPAKRATLPKFLFKEKSSLMREKVAIS